MNEDEFLKQSHKEGHISKKQMESFIHKKAMAELGGYNEMWPSTASGLSYFTGIIIILSSIFIMLEDFGLGLLLMFIGFCLLFTYNFLANSEYNKCYRNGLQIQSENQAKYLTEENEKRQNYSNMQIRSALNLRKRGGLKNLQQALDIFNKEGHTIEFNQTYLEMAQEKERLLDYKGAIDLFEKADFHDDAKRVRRKMLDEKKVDQTVVQGDQITRTEIKDSVLNRSNVGGGSSKAEELREAKSLLDEGVIDDDEFKIMKKDILGK